jgi:predicted AAA+ superfamily ATPase
MAALPRLYERLFAEHLREHRQMVLVAGPRQVGKTTTCRTLASERGYLNWDDQDHRRLILQGPGAVAAHVGLERLGPGRPVVVFDELHRYGRWKTFLKGFFDTWGERARIIVTGSSRLDVYRRGGDSLMGRYFLYRMHPLSVGELVDPTVPSDPVRRLPRQLAADAWTALWEHGGFPEPFVRRDRRFSNRWQRLRVQQLVREDIRDLTRIQEIDRIEVLVALLAERSGTQLSYSSLAGEVQVSVDTMRRWLAVLGTLHHGFLVRPWFKNVTRSLRKEPKWYCTDWSTVADPGRRAETLVAGHLLKAVHLWTDLGLGRYELRYLRDRQKREVDFVIVRDGRPWILIEVKLAEERLDPALRYFQEHTGAQHAFQAVLEMPWVEADCFARTDPCTVPARTLLSQLA